MISASILYHRKKFTKSLPIYFTGKLKIAACKSKQRQWATFGCVYWAAGFCMPLISNQILRRSTLALAAPAVSENIPNRYLCHQTYKILSSEKRICTLQMRDKNFRLVAVI